MSQQRETDHSEKLKRELKSTIPDTDERKTQIVGGGKKMKALTESEMKKGVKVIGGRSATDDVEILSRHDED